MRPITTNPSPPIAYGRNQARRLKPRSMGRDSTSWLPYFATKWPAYDGDQYNFLGYDRRHFIKIPEEIVASVDDVVPPTEKTATLRQRMEDYCPSP